MSTILDQIVATKRQEIAAARQTRPEAELRAALPDAPRRFFRHAHVCGKDTVCRETCDLAIPATLPPGDYEFTLKLYSRPQSMPLLVHLEYPEK